MEVVMPKILLLEDDFTMLSLLQTLLQMEGYQVISISDPSLEGIMTSTQAEMPDLALIDVHLRNLSGYDVLRSIRSDPALGRTRVVMSSGSECRNECIEFGADDFLLKPYMPDDLIQMIHHTIETQESIDKTREKRA